MAGLFRFDVVVVDRVFAGVVRATVGAFEDVETGVVAAVVGSFGVPLALTEDGAFGMATVFLLWDVGAFATLLDEAMLPEAATLLDAGLPGSGTRATFGATLLASCEAFDAELATVRFVRELCASSDFVSVAVVVALVLAVGFVLVIRLEARLSAVGVV
ncbi:MAG: hypothetical protein AAGG44_08365 [Planctomycetota bacterium]